MQTVSKHDRAHTSGLDVTDIAIIEAKIVAMRTKATLAHWHR